MVEEDDEFAHDGGQREFLGFAGGDQPLVKGLEDRVEAGGDEGGHVEDAAGQSEGVRP